MGIKEMIAAKKAAAAQTASAPIVDVVDKMVAEIPKQLATTLPAVEKAEPQKPLTFAEKLALKRAQAEAKEAPKPATASSPMLDIEEAVAEVKKEEEDIFIDPDTLPDDPAQAAAFIDIKRRVAKLKNIMGDDLPAAMAQLKKSLKENPAACELMLDEDLGMMVVALRICKVISGQAMGPRCPWVDRARNAALLCFAAFFSGNFGVSVDRYNEPEPRVGHGLL